MTPRSDSRARAVQATAKLLQRQGYHATGLSQIIEESGTPRGSFYFNFPGGKEELAIEAMRAASDEVTKLIRTQAARATDPAGVVRGVTWGLGRWLERSQFQEGCPIATVALEMVPGSPTLQAVAADAYRAWQEVVVEALVDHGVPAERADGLAVTLIAGLEGALLLARVQGRIGPLDTVTRELAALVTAAAAAPGGRGSRPSAEAVAEAEPGVEVEGGAGAQ